MIKFPALCLWLLSLNSQVFAAFTGICDTNTGMSDSNILALSSQPGFCQTYGYEAGKPECLHLPKSSYQSQHLTLHGLWPNQNACGQHYGFCGVKPQTNHCDYSPVALSPEIAEHLKKIMPSYKYGSCLERHEWNKHGSCQTRSANDYFSLAQRLVTEVDQSVLGQYLTKNQGKAVPLATLRAKIAQAFGANNAGKIYLGCKNGILVDIYIQLPALIPFDESLALLVALAPSYQYRDACPRTVKISDFNQDEFVAIT